MRRAATLAPFLLAAACWLGAGPGGVTVQAWLACRHHQAHLSHGGHPAAPGDGPCFCDEMTGGSSVAVSPAVPAPIAAPPAITRPVRVQPYTSPFPLPPSPSFAPISPPPNGLV